MTAVVGILNKTGIAIAADSAVTISTGNKERKIYNSANKVFTLSKYHPVAIMIYSSAQFNGIPWEILIKEYRKQLGNKSFEELKNYRTDFIKFLEKRIALIPKEYQDFRLKGFVDFIVSKLFEEVVESNLELIEKEPTESKQRTLFKKLLRTSLKDYLNEAGSYKQNEGFKKLTKAQFLKSNDKFIDEIIGEYFSKVSITKKDKDSIKNLIYKLSKSDQFFGNYTGLIFAGYGEKEIFPSMLPLKISEVFNNKIRYIFDTDNQVEITHKSGAGLRPFAQRDVIDLILSGVDNQIQSIVYKTFDQFLNKFIELIGKNIEVKDPKLAKQIRGIDSNSILSEFMDEIRKIQLENHIKPLMSTIGTLSKEDLSELAESLIYLTYLKRRMSFSEESVGGPVDVAIITKGDGFIWMKRKHYFDSDLNHSFINNYLKK